MLTPKPFGTLCGHTQHHVHALFALLRQAIQINHFLTDSTITSPQRLSTATANSSIDLPGPELNRSGA